MISTKVKYRPSSTKELEGRLYIRIIRNRLTRQIKTGYQILAHEWDEKNSRIRTNQPCEERTGYLKEVEKGIALILDNIRSSVRFLEWKTANYTTDDILRVYHSHKDRYLFPFMRQIAQQLSLTGKTRTSETYICALKSFMCFRNDIDIFLFEMNSDVMIAYEGWLKQRGVCVNTVSFYMRILRAVYNRGVERGLTPQQFPFKHVYTGVEKTVKRAISLQTVRQIKQVDLVPLSPLDYARDIFMMSFYTRGMAFVDMAYLKKSDLNNGVLSYRRKKTGQQLLIRWEECMQAIVDKYPTLPESPYLLPIIMNPHANQRKQYRNAILNVNKYLKKLSSVLGISAPLTTYVARHSWASIAKSKNIPISVISEGMGHDSEMTTRIYLSALDSDVVDEANSTILKDL